MVTPEPGGSRHPGTVRPVGVVSGPGFQTPGPHVPPEWVEDGRVVHEWTVSSIPHEGPPVDVVGHDARPDTVGLGGPPEEDGDGPRHHDDAPHGRYTRPPRTHVDVRDPDDGSFGQTVTVLEDTVGSSTGRPGDPSDSSVRTYLAVHTVTCAHTVSGGKEPVGKRREL